MTTGLVQCQNFNGATNGASVYTSGPLTTTPGNMIAVAVAMYTNGGAFSASGITDSKGNNWAAVPASPGTPGSNTNIWVFTSQIASGGAGHTFSVQENNAGNSTTMFIAECSGCNGIITASTAAGTTGGSQSHAGGTVAANTGDIVLCFSCDDARTADTFSAGTSFTIPTNGQFGSALVPAFLQFVANVASGNYTGQYTTVQFAGYSQVILALEALAPIPSGSLSLNGNTPTLTNGSVLRPNTALPRWRPSSRHGRIVVPSTYDPKGRIQIVPKMPPELRV